jgi:hypothetical protein
MAKRGWSLTDAQLERRKQNPAARRSTRSDAATTRAKATARSKALSRPSDYQQRRATAKATGTVRPKVGMQGRPVTSAEAAYSQPDAASISNRPSNTERQYLHSFRVPGAAQDTRVAATAQPSYSPHSRQSSVQSHLPEVAKAKRQRSTQAAYRAADASMFNSNVTPKAERVENKRPRSRMSPDQNVFW